MSADEFDLDYDGQLAPLNAPWRDDAACRGMGVDIFFIDRPGNTSGPAKAVCARCSVRSDCLADAMSEPLSLWQGIRGGLTARERRELRLGQLGSGVRKSGLGVWAHLNAPCEVGVGELAELVGYNVRSLPRGVARLVSQGWDVVLVDGVYRFGDPPQAHSLGS